MSIAGQMIGIILLGALLANWLNSKYAIGQLGVALIILLAVFLAMGSVLRELLSEKPDSDKK